MIGYLGGVTILLGFFIFYLADKQWYIEYLQNIMPENTDPSKSERSGAVIVIIVGLLLMISSLTS